MSREARDFIDEQVPLPLQNMLPKAISTAYDAVGKLVRANTFLDVESAIFGRGHLLAWAVDYELFKLIRDGHWPFDCEWRPFHRPTGKYLRIDTGDAFVTISQIPEMGEGPRLAKFRSNASLSNGPLLPYAEFEREAAQEERNHLVIGHGYQRLDFIIIGAPHPDRPKSWIDRTDNILKRDASGSAMELPPSNSPSPPSTQAPIEGDDIEIDLDLVDHIKKIARDEDV